MNATTYYAKLAKKHALPLVQLTIDNIDISMITIKHRIDYLTLQAIPISQTATTIKIATANPDTDNQQKIKDFFPKNSKKTLKSYSVLSGTLRKYWRSVSKNQTPISSPIPEICWTNFIVHHTHLA